MKNLVTHSMYINTTGAIVNYTYVMPSRGIIRMIDFAASALCQAIAGADKLAYVVVGTQPIGWTWTGGDNQPGLLAATFGAFRSNATAEFCLNMNKAVPMAIPVGQRQIIYFEGSASSAVRIQSLITLHVEV
jgi:hypothetical protein